MLTAQALARNSDIFKAGVDLAGVHLWGSSIDPESVSFKSSVIGAIDGWKSPVLLVHGDDDRNVAFQQTTGLVQLLRARNVEYELIVFPDDTHESMLHSRWIYTLDRMEKFLDKHLGDDVTVDAGPELAEHRHVRTRHIRTRHVRTSTFGTSQRRTSHVFTSSARPCRCSSGSG